MEKRRYLIKKIPEIVGYPFATAAAEVKPEAPRVEEKPREKNPEPGHYPTLIPIKMIHYPDGRVETQYTLGSEHYRATPSP